MFRKNSQHFQVPMFGTIDSLPVKQQERLEGSWAGDFYREYFMRMDEEPFAVLYSDEPSRPNIAVNVLVGLETLKSGFGWSDAEMYDHFCYDMQVRYALGYRDLSEGHFELRTMYNFRKRVTEHRQETGENLLEQAFEQISDEQVVAFKLKTNKLR
ncbi:MAG: transposase, partial [Anaerolineae bacterium]|nr:transposase [Anaerolineae bacterium]